MFWINFFRIVTGLMCVLSMVIMSRDFYVYHKIWNEKTRDYWYGRMMWAVVGLSASIEGLIRDSPFRYTFVFTAVAIIVTLKGNLQKGKWGSDNKVPHDNN